MSWINDIVSPKTRQWEEFYRNRFQHDKIVRSTHGVNCTGSCSWNVCVKDGIVTWELQATDYPIFDKNIPPYEPRGCQRGISFSWYLYSPIRIKYPYFRGALLDIWEEAKAKCANPVEAWDYIQNDDALRTRYQRARGKGGFRRANWKQVLEIMAAANIRTIKKYGPDRVTGFSPIPAMSQISYAAGARFLQLMGGVCLSFYDWYCDLPPASPETWGEQTDVGESADWYNSKFVAIMGANLNMTRTPDCHFIPEAKINGTKVVVLSPDFSQVAKFADQWVPLHQGQDGAFWMAVNHVILTESHYKNPTEYFLDYQKKYSDNPFLVEIENQSGKLVPGKFLRAGLLDKYKGEENGDWKFLMQDESGALKMPMGSMGHRWQEKQGQWNLLLKDSIDGSDIKPVLTLKDSNDEVLNVDFVEFATEKHFARGVPVKHIETAEGKKTYTTVYDLLMAQYGVNRGLGGDYPDSYDDTEHSYTPAWQERFTGIDRSTIIQFANDWCRTAKFTEGKCSVIIGAGIDHWYHNNLIYRAAINALIFTGCVGKNGGGLNHYVGQEKLAPAEPWGAIAFAKDWQGPVRLQNAPSWHYMHTDQWRYDTPYNEINASPEQHPISKGHTADLNAKAVRCGWLPFYPQYTQNPLDLCKEAQDSGAANDEDIKKYVLDKIKSGEVNPAIEDIDSPDSFPRVWYIWRGNAIGTSSKGHEYFLKHYLGTHTNAIAHDDVAKEHVEEIKWYEKAPTGKMDLIIDVNFRMDTSALYSDIVLPTASWYEKADLNTTDMHTFIHPLSPAIPPVWESKSDWNIFRDIAYATQEMSKNHFTEPVKDIVALPLMHDTPAELAQPSIKDWKKGECEAIPGKTMYNLVVVERDYTKIYDKFCSFGPNPRKGGLGAHGVSYPIEDFYDKMVAEGPTCEVDGVKYPSLKEDMHACNAILNLASVTNGELAYRGYQTMEKKTGLQLTDLAEQNRGKRLCFKDIQAKPTRLHNAAMWSGLIDEGRAYTAFSYNVDRMVPWRTITGRQSLYLDHEGYIGFGEHLPTYKPSPTPEAYGDLRVTEAEGNCLKLNYLTPHGKWHIHSTYGDTHRMLTLSRGAEPFWISPEDADKLGLKDNEYVEVFNDNGVVVTRANVSYRIPPGMCFVYHATERTYSVPKSPIRGNKRAGMNNSLTRVHLKPNLMLGGYGQFTYHFNYWGPTGVNRDTFILVRKLDSVEW
ncbi:MAG: nitrate reductase subunit alpha [Bacteriovoracaceae bacterium]|jgi:nitrate reductase / nitrite oxidoreductase, alpha subunit|nr:nitrate reductase subunit alpha [Bacteriovoracaceae bacterium]